MEQKTLLETYGLEFWWDTMFTEPEKQRIREVYAKHTGGDVIDRDPLVLTSGSIQLDPKQVGVTKILQQLTQWFQRNEDRDIWIKISESLHHFAEPHAHILDKHFALIDTMRAYYRKREEPEFLAKTISTCTVMIDMHKEVAGAMFDAGLGRVQPEATQRLSDQVIHTELGPQVLPGHPGFKQLAIIHEKQKEFQAALDLCIEARDAGWAGDWDKRIERLEKKLGQ